ncbi:helix-turn-helix domain-containing protein [Corynebacterium testudinoris]|uniref:helix-turn-helix domain-containing protein n=1 Tax=Corynebacterium testudinoris TaxID=136857 RepID=UPI001C8C1AED
MSHSPLITSRVPLSEASTIHRVSVDTLRRHVRTGRLPATKEGPRRAYMVDLDDVAHLLSDKRRAYTPDQVRAWAKEVAATAPPVSPTLAAEIVSILRGGAPA